MSNNESARDLDGVLGTALAVAQEQLTEHGGIMPFALNEATRFISDERLKEATSATSDFDLRTFPHRSETVFLVIPPDRM